MKKNILRSFYCFMVMLFMGGGLLLIPSFAGGINNKNTSLNFEEDVFASEDNVNTYSSDGFFDPYNPPVNSWGNEVLDYSITLDTSAGAINEIATADDLAYVAYKIVMGDSSFASANYSLKAGETYDLSAKLWTPIGTASLPYSGIFYGNGAIVTGVTVTRASSVSNSGSGLFGNVTGSINDIVLSGRYDIHNTDSNKIGKLVGQMSANAEVVNCFDITNDDYIKTIGSTESSTKIIRGSSRNGTDIDYTTKEEVDNTITVNSTSYTPGYIGMFNANGGNFKKKGDATFANENIKIALTTFGGEVDTLTSLSVQNPLYGTSIPTEYRFAENNDVYFIREGFKGTLSSESLNYTVNWEEKNVDLKIYYGYGEPSEKVVNLTVAYDSKIERTSLTRLGYQLNKAYTSADRTEAFSFDLDNDTINDTVNNIYLDWIANEEAIGLNFSLAWKNGYTNNIFPMSDFTITAGEKNVNVAGKDESTVNNIFNSINLNDYKVEDQLVFNFTLKDGYTLAGATTGTNFENATILNEYNFSQNGIFGMFADSNIDSATPVKYKVEIGENNSYTVTFENIVATGEIIFIVEQKRDDIKVNFEGDKVEKIELSINSGATQTFVGNSLTELNNVLNFSLNTGDHFILKIIPNARYFILTPIISSNGENKFEITYEGSDGKYINQTFSRSQGSEYIASNEDEINISIQTKTKAMIFSSGEFGFVDGLKNDFIEGQTLGISSTENFDFIQSGSFQDWHIEPNADNSISFYIKHNKYYKTVSGSLILHKGNSISGEVIPHTEEVLKPSSEGYEYRVYKFANLTPGDNYFIDFKMQAIKYSLTQKRTLYGEEQTYEGIAYPVDEFIDYAIVYVASDTTKAPITEFLPGQPLKFELKFQTDPEKSYLAKFAKIMRINEAMFDIPLTRDPETCTFVSDEFSLDLTQDVIMPIDLKTMRLGYDFPHNNDIKTNVLVNNWNGAGNDSLILKDNIKWKLNSYTGNYPENDFRYNNFSCLNDVPQNFLDFMGLEENQFVFDIKTSYFSPNVIDKGYYIAGWRYTYGTHTFTTQINKNETQDMYFAENSVYSWKLFNSKEFLDEIGEIAKTTDEILLQITPIIRQKTVKIYGSHGNNISDNQKGLLTVDGGVNWGVENSDLTNQLVYYYNHEDNTANLSDFIKNIRRAGYAEASNWTILNENFDILNNQNLSYSNGLITIDARVWSENLIEENGYSVSIIMQPEFTDKLSYQISFKAPNGDAIDGSINLSIDALLNFVVNENDFSGIFNDSVQYLGRAGYTISGFEILGSKEGAKHAVITKDDQGKYAFTLDNSMFATLVANADYLTSGQIFNVQILDEANPYTITLLTDSKYEQVEGESSFEVIFDNAIGTIPFNVTRDGYKLVGFAETETKTIIDSETIYNYVGNINVYPVWERDLDNSFLTASLKANSGLYYIEREQEILAGEISATVAGEKVVYTGAGLVANGENISEISIVNEDETQVITSGLSLNRLNAGNYGPYKLKITISDSLSAGRGFEVERYSITSAPISATINANKIYLDSVDMETYYTGSESVAETENSNRGNIKFTHMTSESDAPLLSIANTRVTVVDASGKFDVKGSKVDNGISYPAKFTFRLTEQQAYNYGLTEQMPSSENTTSEYTIATSDADSNGGIYIVKLPIKLNVKNGAQQGFYLQDLLHKVVIGSTTATYGDKGDVIKDFDFSVQFDSVLTSSSLIGVYGQDEGKTFTVRNFQVTKNGNVVSSDNYTFEVVGTYEIVDSSIVANTFTYDVRYLVARNGNLDLQGGSLIDSYGNAQYMLSVKDAQGNLITDEQYSEFDENGGTLFTIIGNGTDRLAIAVRKNAGISFTITLSEKIADSRLSFLGFLDRDIVASWQEDSCSYIDNFVASAGREINLNLQGSEVDQSFLAVLTDVRQVKLYENKTNEHIINLTPKTFYLSSGDDAGIDIVDPDLANMEGFAFDKWATSNGLTASKVNGGKFNFNSTGGSTPVEAIGRWTLLNPEYTSKKNLFNDKASLIGDANANLVINLNDLFTFTNKNNNNNLIKYTYSWVDSEGNEFSTAESYDFGRKTTAINGNFTVKVTASYTDVNGASGNKQTTNSEDFTFEIAIQTRVISGTMVVETNPTDGLVYNNARQEGNVIIKLTVDGAGKDFILANNLVENSDIWFTIGGAGNEIKNAGTYTLTLNIDPTVYSGNVTAENVVVAPYTIILTADDVKSLTKVFGYRDPALEINYPINGESVKIKFNREAGESVGNKVLTVLDPENTNYKAVAKDGEGLFFVITAPTSKLQINLDKRLEYSYNGKAVASIDKVYFNSSTEAWFTTAGWYLQAKDVDGNILATTRVSLFHMIGENLNELETNIETILNEFNFNVVGASKNVGEYGIAVSLGVENATFPNGADFGGNIANDKAIKVNQAVITVSDIEKVFDEKNTFSWNSQKADANITVNVSGIVDGEEVVISGTLSQVNVGNTTVATIALGSGEVENNYLLADNKAEIVAKIVPSKIEITLDGANLSQEYGKINTINYNVSSTMADFIGLTLKNGEDTLAKINDYVSVYAVTIDGATNADNSLSDIFATASSSLKASENKYVVRFTLSSQNYTFGAEINESGTYTKEYELKIEVTKKDLSLSQTATVTKAFDGNANLPATHDNMQIGSTQAFAWIGSGLVGVDNVTVTGSYDSEQIGDRTLNLTFGGDGANYNIIGIPAGRIENAIFDFTAKFDTITFVDGEQPFEGNNSFRITYTGNNEKLVSDINDVDNFATRVGYTQTGWNFKFANEEGTEETLEVSNENVTALLKQVLANNNTLELLAIWEQQDKVITVNFDSTRGQIKNGEIAGNTFTTKYYNGEINLDVLAENGYYFKDFSVDNTENAIITSSGTNTKNGSLEITGVKDDITITVSFDYIIITITANDGEHAGATIVSGAWDTASKDFNVNTAGVTAKALLPQYELEDNTYNLKGWKITYDGLENPIVIDNTDTRSIWEIVGGNSILTNSRNVTATAIWESAPISFNINHENADIVSVSVGGENVNGTNAGANLTTYGVHFGDNVVITFSGKTGYKYSGNEFSGVVDKIIDAEKGKRENRVITLSGLKQHSSTLTLNMESIVVTINANANKQPYSTIDGNENVEFKIKVAELASTDTIGEELAKFATTKAGTYNQTAWKYESNSVAFTDTILDFINSTYASEKAVDAPSELDADFTFTNTLNAEWTPVQYTITFDLNGEGSFVDGATTTLVVDYGEPITGMPEVTHTGGKVNIWSTTQNGLGGSSYAEGDKLSTPAEGINVGATEATLTLYAVWRDAPYDVTISYGDHITAVYRGQTQIVNGNSTSILSGTSVTLDITLEGGYVIDTATLDTVNGAFAENENVVVNGNQITLNNITKPRTLTITAKPATYKLNINLRGEFEKVTGAQSDSEGNYYIEVEFNEAYSATDLANLVFTRAGYKPVSIKNKANDTIIATYNDVDKNWNVIGNPYTLTADSIIEVVWAEDYQNYLTITNKDEVNELVYNSEARIVATGNVEVDDAEFDLTSNTTFANGDSIENYYYARVEEDDTLTQFTADKTLTLSLKDVKDSGTYAFVIIVRDAITGEDYILRKDTNLITIVKAVMTWSQQNFNGYYTGTKAYVAVDASEDKGHALIDGKEISDATFNRVELTGNYNVGNDRSAKVYLNLTDEARKNFTDDCIGKDTYGYFILLEGSVTITKTPIEFEVTGAGLETGKTHQVSLSQAKTNSGVDLSEFAFSVTAQTTGNTGVQTQFTILDNTRIATLSGISVDVENFVWTASGTYTIETPATTYNLSAKKLTIDKTFAKVDGRFTISNLRYGDKEINIGNKNFFNYIEENNTLFTISGNGTDEIVVAMKEGVTVTFNVTVSGVTGLKLVAWSNEEDEATLAENLFEKLKTIEGVEANYKDNITVSANGKLTVVYTNVKYVKADFAHDSLIADYYVEVGGTAQTIARPDNDKVTGYWKGFEFAKWTTNSQGLEIEGDMLSAEAGTNILPATITANWEIALPVADGNKTINVVAEFGKKQTITLAEAIGNITNKANEGDLNYSYTWYDNNGNVMASTDAGQSVEIVKDFTAHGKYKVVITASKEGFTSKTTEVEFDVEVAKQKISVSTSANSGEYKHANFVGDINFDITIGTSTQTYTLAELLKKENFWFEISYKKNAEATSQEVNEIINAGIYTIAFNFDTTVYEIDSEYTTSFVVSKKVETISSIEGLVNNLYKFVGEEDPDPMTITKVFDFGDGNTESVVITVRRKDTSVNEIGFYEVEFVSADNDNYAISIAEGNTFFEIKRSEGRLEINILSPNAFTKSYNKQETKFGLVFDETENTWSLNAYNNGSDVVIATSKLDLTLRVGGKVEVLSGDKLKNVFTGITFTIGNVVNAGSYTISLDINNAYYPNSTITNATNFVITQADLTVSASKEFDATSDFTEDTDIVVSGLQGDDTITIIGKFDSAFAGERNLLDIAISAEETDNINNYNIASVGKGNITPSKETNISFAPTEKLDLVYGQIKQGMSISEILALIEYSLTIGGNYTTAIADGFVNLGGYEFEDSAKFSTGKYLASGEHTLKVTINSNNYQELIDGKTFVVNLKLGKVEISFAGTQGITKTYDRTDAIPTDFDRWIIDGALAGDVILVDKDATKFESANVGTHKVNVVLDLNSDGANYVIGDEGYPTGIITASTVTLVVDETALLGHDNIVNNDGEEINIDYRQFAIEYKDNNVASEVLANLRAPSRKGFKVIGWKNQVLSESGEVSYQEITEENILALLDQAYDNTNHTITIYPVWEIQRYSLDITYDNAQATIAASGDTVKEENGKFTFDYFSDVKVSITGKDGYVFDSFEVTAGEIKGGTSSQGENTKKDGQISLNQIKSNVSLVVNMDTIKVTIKLDGNKPELVEDIIVSGNDWNLLEKEIAYVDTAEINAWSWLAKFSASQAGTYTHTGYSYTNGDITEAQTLKEILDRYNSDIVENFEIIFSAVWTGEEYEIVFNVTDGGTLVGENKITNIKFGDEIESVFPTATLTGKDFNWKTSEGKTFEQGSILDVIGEEKNGVWTLDLYTNWFDGTYSLTINIGDHIDVVRVGTVNVTSGDAFNLVYGNSLEISITPESGYKLSYNYSGDSIELAQNGNILTISNMPVDRVLTINAVAQDNELTVTLHNAEIESVTGGTETNGIIQSKTGATVIVTIAPDAGYEFESGKTYLSTSGNGKFAEIVTNGKLVITWSDFRGGASVEASASAIKNKINFNNIPASVDAIYANGQRIEIKDASATFAIETDKDLTIKVVLKYGYKDIGFSSSNADIIVTPMTEQDVFDNDTKIFYREYSLTGIKAGTNITLSATEREYKVQAVSGDESMGTVTSDTNVITMMYGSSTTVSAKATDGYVFYGWFVGEISLSADENYNFEANETMKDYFENNLNEDGVLELVARFGVAERPVTIVNGSKGTLVYNFGNGEEFTLSENSKATGNVSFGNDLVVTISAYEGYETIVEFTLAGAIVDGSEWYDAQTNVITLPVSTSTPDTINISYEAREAYITVRGILEVALSRTYGVDDGGKIYLADKEGNLDNNASYLDPYPGEGFKVDGAHYRLLSETDATLYFIAKVNKGYKFYVDGDSQLEIREISRNKITENGKELEKVHFEVSKIKDNAKINGNFIAEYNQVNIRFRTEGGNVDIAAGKFVVDTTSPLVSATTGTSNAIINAVTTANVNIGINIGFNYQLVLDNSGNIKYYVNDENLKSLITTNIDEDGSSKWQQDGFIQKANLLISGIDRGGEIIIYVEPKTYNVALVNETETLYVFENIRYGSNLVITDEIREKIVASKPGFTFEGYFTKVLGMGNQYIDAKGNAISAWFENVYEWVSGSYKQVENYDKNTNTYSIYASWSFEKERLTIDFIPPELKDKTDINVRDIVTNLNKDTSWTDIDKKFYAEVLVGTEMTLQAYPFEGYKFIKWVVARDGVEDGLPHTDKNYTYIAGLGEVTITAVYEVEFSLTVNNKGGKASLVQEGKSATSEGSFDSTKEFTLVAEEHRGYKFVGWETLDGQPFGEKGEGETIEHNTPEGKYYTAIWRYKVPAGRVEPLNLVAVFEGDVVGVRIIDSAFAEHGKITYLEINGIVYTDGSEILREYEAKVGDIVKIKLSADYGYSVAWNEKYSLPQYVLDEDAYIYEIIADDIVGITGSIHENMIVLAPVATNKQISFKFNVNLKDGNINVEDAGTIIYRKPNGGTMNIVTGSETDKVPFGNTLYLDVALRANYRVETVALLANGRRYILDFNKDYIGYNSISKRIEIYTPALSNYKPDLTKPISIEINFARNIWTEVRSDRLEGEGSANKPFIISSEADLAYVAYMINTEENLAYAQAYYKLTRSLNLAGRFWEPIGIEQNPFDGVLDLGTNSIENIELYKTYTNPTTSHNGLFHHITEHAQVLSTNNALIIGISVACGIIVLIILIVVIIILTRRKRRKKLEELANS